MNAGGKPHWDKRVNESTAALLKSLCDSDLVPEDSLRSAVKANGLVGQQPDQDPRSVIHNFVKLLVPTPTAAEVRLSTKLQFAFTKTCLTYHGVFIQKLEQASIHAEMQQALAEVCFSGATLGVGVTHPYHCVRAGTSCAVRDDDSVNIWTIVRRT